MINSKTGLLLSTSRQIKTSCILISSLLSPILLYLPQSFHPFLLQLRLGRMQREDTCAAASPLTSGRTTAALQFFTFPLQDTEVSAGCCNPNRPLLPSSISPSGHGSSHPTGILKVSGCSLEVLVRSHSSGASGFQEQGAGKGGLPLTSSAHEEGARPKLKWSCWSKRQSLPLWRARRLNPGKK